jgi:protein-S-isoprenylcysteine O-methyltransferase Ste14
MAGAAEVAATARVAVAAGPRRRAPRVPASGLALALGLGAAGAHLAVWGPRAPWGQAGPAGLALAAGGLAWAVWAAALLRAAGTPIGPAGPPRVLVDEGPYRLGRHPMYLGTALLLLGLALGLGVPLLAVAAAWFAGIVASVHVPHEEAQLLARFGGWYRDYASSVRRWG